MAVKVRIVDVILIQSAKRRNENSMLKSANDCIEGYEGQSHKYTLELEDSTARCFLQVDGYGSKSNL